MCIEINLHVLYTESFMLNNKQTSQIIMIIHNWMQNKYQLSDITK